MSFDAKRSAERVGNWQNNETTPLRLRSVPGESRSQAASHDVRSVHKGSNQISSQAFPMLDNTKAIPSSAVK